MRRLDALMRPAFLAALVVLILNDTLLKPLFHNALTGKLSDVAGVFAFAYACAVVVGRRAFAVHVAVALFFVWWKSPWSQPVIDAWNGAGPWPVARVVDAGDLLALLVLPLSLRSVRAGLAQAACAAGGMRWPRLAVAGVALVAFTATSRAPEPRIDYHARYRSELGVPEGERIIAERSDMVAYQTEVALEVEIGYCTLDAYFEVHPLPEGGSLIVVDEAGGDCGNDAALRKGLGEQLDTFMREALQAERGAFPEPGTKAHVFPASSSVESEGTPRTECSGGDVSRLDTEAPTSAAAHARARKRGDNLK